MTNETTVVNRDDRGSEREEITRVRLSQQSLQESIDTEPGYVKYLLNEVPADIERHKQAGWVLDTSTSNGQKDGINRVQVNRRPDAPVKFGVVIKKRKDWYDEDVAAERREKALEDAQLDPSNPNNKIQADYGEMKVSYSTVMSKKPT